MKNGDAPAFHQATEWNPISDLRGLTKREYFVAMAMQGLCVNRITGELKKGECVDVAEMSILIADELLKQLGL